ncbi:hypothetical protein, partial [Klebsiella pneumoniae]|uniref:hypothetical protein n=1 Tax=Klebsiella pneumoniae TaxID=573 RepID=UPI00272F4498
QSGRTNYSYARPSRRSVPGIVAPAPAAVYPFFARYGRILEKWVVRALATLFTVAGLLSIAGIRGLVAFAIVGGSAVGIWYGARRLPQATGA